MAQSISRRWAFLGLLRLMAGAFSERLRPLTGSRNMSSQPSPTSARRIIWPSVVTVISAAILIGAEVFGAAFAGGWALANMLDLGPYGVHIMQGLLFAVGLAVMVAFIRNASRVEPFTTRG